MGAFSQRKFTESSYALSSAQGDNWQYTFLGDITLAIRPDMKFWGA